MAYIDGFLCALPKANRAAFIEHASRVDAIFLENGATRVVETWSDDVPHGEVTDFYRAVAATEDERVVFSWIEWPDKATRDAGMAAMMETVSNDPELSGAAMPFDGKRMVFGGFEPLLVLEN